MSTSEKKPILLPSFDQHQVRILHRSMLNKRKKQLKKVLFHEVLLVWCVRAVSKVMYYFTLAHRTFGAKNHILLLSSNNTCISC